MKLQSSIVPGDPHLSIHHVHLFVRDMDRSLEFFTQRLGFRLLFDTYAEHVDRFILLGPADGSTFIGLISPKPGTPEFDLIGRSGHVIFATDDVQSKYSEWSARGVPFKNAPYGTSWRGVVATFADPDGNPFALMSQDDLTVHIEAQRRAAHEMEIAREVQAQLFPQSLPHSDTIQLSGRCVQARQIGGDYYDFLPLGDRSLGLVIGDIAGKGIAAALLMANLQASIRSQAATAPEKLLESVNRHLYSNTTPAAYATLFFGEYDEATGVLRYVNCGHPPALIARSDGRTDHLTATATVLGLFSHWECEVAETRLDPGDTLVLYTDGVSECSDANGEEFGIPRLTSSIHRGSTLDDIFDELRRFGGDEPQDDVTLIVARRRLA